MAPVKVDVTEGTQVILADGVNQGDQIVVDGQEKLKDGSRVSPRQGAPTGAGRGIGASGQPGARAGSGNGDAQHSGSSAAGVGAANGPATAAGDASGQRQGAQRDRQSNAQQGNRGQRP
jgi:multidrug efflux system membrane fusion protein